MTFKYIDFIWFDFNIMLEYISYDFSGILNSIIYLSFFLLPWVGHTGPKMAEYKLSK